MRYSYAPGSAAADARSVTPPSPPPPAYVIVRPAQPYDLATPGTPQGLLLLARAAQEGGGWRAGATLAVAMSADGAEVLASLCLRLLGDTAAGARRAWACYVRVVDDEGRVTWKPHGAALLDATATREAHPYPVRPIGLTELKAILSGRPYVPPPPRPGPPRLACPACDKVTPFSTTTWRPYVRHRCDTAKEGSR